MISKLCSDLDTFEFYSYSRSYHSEYNHMRGRNMLATTAL